MYIEIYNSVCMLHFNIYKQSCMHVFFLCKGFGVCYGHDRDLLCAGMGKRMLYVVCKRMHVCMCKRIHSFVARSLKSVVAMIESCCEYIYIHIYVFVCQKKTSPVSKIDRKNTYIHKTNMNAKAGYIHTHTCIHTCMQTYM